MMLATASVILSFLQQWRQAAVARRVVASRPSGPPRWRSTLCRRRSRLAADFAVVGSLELCARLRRKSRFQPYLTERPVSGTEWSDRRRAAGISKRDDALRESRKLLLIQQPGRGDPRVCDRQWRNRKSQLRHAGDKP